jgi:hypothetical protein
MLVAGAMHGQGRRAWDGGMGRTYDGCGLRRLDGKTVGFHWRTRAGLLGLLMFALNLRIFVSNEVEIRMLEVHNALGPSWR